MIDATKEQVQPKGNGVDVGKLVQADIEARCELGKQKYGERLQPFNGRDALLDAYQEALDLCQYLRQAIEETPKKIYLVKDNDMDATKLFLNKDKALKYFDGLNSKNKMFCTMEAEK